MLKIESKSARASRLAIIGTVALVAFGAMGCDLQSQVSLSVDPAANGGAGGGIGSFSITTINSVATASWIVNSAGTAFFNTRSMPVVGTCSRGVSAVQVTINSVVQGSTYPCPNAGSLTINLSFPTDGLFTVIFTPLGADGTALTANAVTQGIYAKTSSPPAPIVTTVPAAGTVSSPFVVSVGPGTSNPSGTVVVNGTTSVVTSDYVASVAELTYGLGTMVSSPSAGTFSYTLSISLGQSITLSFRASDVVGNVSSPTNISVVTANVLGIYQWSAGGLATPNVSGAHKMTSFAGAPYLGKIISGSDSLFLGVPLDDDVGP